MTWSGWNTSPCCQHRQKTQYSGLLVCQRWASLHIFLLQYDWLLFTISIESDRVEYLLKPHGQILLFPVICYWLMFNLHVAHDNHWPIIGVLDDFCCIIFNPDRSHVWSMRSQESAPQPAFFFCIKWKSCLVTRGKRLANVITLLSLGVNQSKQKTQKLTNR